MPSSISIETIPQRCLLVGVAGAGMRALAAVLSESGRTVFGTDALFDSPHVPLSGPFDFGRDRNVQLLTTQAAKGILADVCICSAAIPADHSLRKQAVANGIPVMSLATALGRVFAGRRQVCVAGTHGKSTTTALLSWLLTTPDHQPGYFVGAQWAGPEDSSFGGRFGQSEFAVIESCEFADSMMQFSPNDVLLTGIDGDHFDWFASPGDEDEAFVRFISSQSSHGQLVANADCGRSMRLLRARFPRRHYCTWSMMEHPAADWHVRILQTTATGTQFELRRPDGVAEQLSVPLYGKHNVSNAAAAAVMASGLGVTHQDVTSRVATFPGLRRRLQHRGSVEGQTLIDDYAHHPTAVRGVLQTLREMYPNRRLRAVFEPHQLSRLQKCRSAFLEGLRLADDILILPVFPAREQFDVPVCLRASRQFAAEITADGTSATCVDGVHSAASAIRSTGRPGDVVITLGAGNVCQIHDEVHR